MRFFRRFALIAVVVACAHSTLGQGGSPANFSANYSDDSPPRPLVAPPGRRPPTVFPGTNEQYDTGYASSGARRLDSVPSSPNTERYRYSTVSDDIIPPRTVVRSAAARTPADTTAVRTATARTSTGSTAGPPMNTSGTVRPVSGHMEKQGNGPLNGIFETYPRNAETRAVSDESDRHEAYSRNNRPTGEFSAIPSLSPSSSFSASPVIDPTHPPIRTASFQGVTPGISTVEEVANRWGAPLDINYINDQLAHLYATEGLNHIEVMFKDGVVRTITVLLDEPFPEEQVRESLKGELHRGKAVMIPNERGEIIGEVFPEKGVFFLFPPVDSARPGLWVNQIAIEPVTAEPFVLRAEALTTEQPTEALRDLLDAVRIDPKDAKAHGLLAQVQLTQGNIDAALVNCEQAIRLDEQRPAYHITLARIFIQMNRPEEAKQYLEETILISDRYPHEKAQALAIIGDLYRTGVQPDYEAAINYHSDAIRLASTLQNHANSTIRLAAKETLFLAHLGAAQDIAWGQWNDKEESINKWLARAKDIALDPEVMKTKRISADFLLRLAITALATQIGFPPESDIDPYVRKVIQTGDELIDGTNDPILKQKYQWDTGLALYDAVQIYQIRRDYTPALRYGELTVKYMEGGIAERRSDTDLYLLGRLYFRLGAIHAIGKKNHSAAIEWFDRAKPVFERLLPKINPEELGRLGETLVSMGVSYWEMNQQDEAIRLSERGLRQIEKGVKYGSVDSSALTIPYSNLATMYEKLNRSVDARKYRSLAEELKASGHETQRR